jgi:tetratricopeptide (TPR) repeat protein
MPEVFSLEPIRRDYGALLEHYQWLADASKSLKTPPPSDLLARTIKAADRWRALDPDVTKDCDLTAKILRTIGGAEAESLAWDYLTTPLALKPNESEPWLGLAQSATNEGDLTLADKCYEAAFAAEPTNAQILWDRAKLLERRGEIARSHELMRQLVAGDWQPRFEGLRLQARQVVEGK